MTGYADESIRLVAHLSLNEHASDVPLAIALKGKPRHCLRRLELEAILSSRRPLRGVSLVSRQEKSSPGPASCISEEILYAAAVFGGGRLDIELQATSCPLNSLSNCNWLVKAVRSTQRFWRGKLGCRIRSDIQDILQTFQLLLERHDFRYIKADVLFNFKTRIPAFTTGRKKQRALSLGAQKAVDDEVFQLALATAACGCLSQDEGRHFFRSMENQATHFCMHYVSHYFLQTHGLDASGHFLPALEELTSSFVWQLGEAFPWFREHAALQEGLQIATSASEEARQRFRTSHSRFIKEVWSAVVNWALQSIDEAFSALEVHFQAAGLRERILSVPKLSALLQKASDALRCSTSAHLASRPWFVSLSKEMDRTQPPLVHFLQPGENFGGVFRAAYTYFGVESGQLLFATHQGFGEPLHLEDDPASLGSCGMLLHVVVRPQTSNLASFDHCLNEVVKVVGSKFSLQRDDYILRLPRSLGQAGKATLGALRILLPFDGMYAQDSQYYHIYCEDHLSMVTFRCSLSQFISFLEDNYGVTDGTTAPMDQIHSDGFGVDPTRLLEEVQKIKGQVDSWLKSGFATNFQRTRACGQTNFLENILGYASSLSQTPVLGALGDFVSRSSAPKKHEDSAQSISKSPEENMVIYNDFFSGQVRLKSQGSRRRERSCGSTSSTDSSASSACCSSHPDHNVKGTKHKARSTSSTTTACSSRMLPPEASAASRTLTEDATSQASAASRTPTEDTAAQVTSTEVSTLFFTPEMMKPAAIGAAACASQLLAIQPQTQWVMSQVQQTLGNGQVLLAPTIDHVMNASIATFSGAIGGAALGAVFGPGGAFLGSICAATLGSEALHWVQSQPQVLNLADLKGYVMARSTTNGEMYLHHRHQVKGPGYEILVLVALTQASVNGVRNIWNAANGEMSAEDVGKAFLRDIRDGSILCASSQGIMQLLKLGEHQAGPILSGICSMALQKPVPVLFAVLGTSWVAYRGIRCFQGQVSAEQLRSDAFLALTVNGAGVATNLLCVSLNLPPVHRALITCFASNSAGLYAYEAWRASRQAQLEERLLDVARDIFGLPSKYTKDSLARRWKHLARMAHPDKNRQDNAKVTFTVLSVCKELLESNLLLQQARRRSRRWSPKYQRIIELSLHLPKWTVQAATTFSERAARLF